MAQKLLLVVTSWILITSTSIGLLINHLLLLSSTLYCTYYVQYVWWSACASALLLGVTWKPTPCLYLFGVYMYVNGVCTPTVTMYTPYRKTFAVFTDSKAGRFFFWPTILFFFQKILFSSSRALDNQPRCSSTLLINCKSKKMNYNPFLFAVV